ncbi:MAG: SGNH/GDSL hydrolase family protein, partial [Candidatus Saccharimonadales bacterium]
MYDDVTQAFSKQAGYYDRYVVKPDAAKWRLNDPVSGQPLAMMRVAASQNGQWLVVETNGGFVRVNTTTKELLTFESPLYGYGYGQDPTYELTISNDGRYAVIAGGNIVERTDLIYDLSTCQPVSNQPLAKAMSCGKRNLKQDVFAELPRDQAAQRFVFSSDAENITVDLQESNIWNRYIMTASGKDYHALEYLAFGDSYSSGEGEYDGAHNYVKGTDGDGKDVAEYDTGIAGYPYATEKCHVSIRSYPYLLAQKATLSQSVFRSVACSGSIMNDVINIIGGNVTQRYNGRYEQFKSISAPSEVVQLIKQKAVNDFIPGRAAQIEFLTKYKPRVASIGIGGNDIGFGDKIKDCIAPGTCSYVNELRQYTGLEIKNLYKKLVDTYQQLHDASPTTRFYVVGYPDIISDDTICAPNVRLNSDERYFAKQVVTYLDTVMGAAANTVGFTYLDIKDSLVGNRLCDLTFDGKSVQGLAFGNDQGPTFDLFGHEITPEIIGNESFHPTNIGHEMIAGTILSRLGGDTIVGHNPCAPQGVVICPTAPSSIEIPSYFLPHPITEQDVRRIELNAANRTSTSPLGFYQQGATLQSVSPTDAQGRPVDDLLPGSSVTTSIHSTERPLESLNVGPDGRASGTITIPSDIEPGYHTIVLKAKNNLYQDIIMYQSVIVYVSLTDLDGDGQPNTTDPCQFVSPAGADADRDGIDDACDGLITKAPDTTKPVVTAVVQGVNDPSAWLNHQVTIMWTVTDDSGDGIAAPASILATTEGEHTYRS